MTLTQDSGNDVKSAPTFKLAVQWDVCMLKTPKENQE